MNNSKIIFGWHLTIECYLLHEILQHVALMMYIKPCIILFIFLFFSKQKCYKIIYKKKIYPFIFSYSLNYRMQYNNILLFYFFRRKELDLCIINLVLSLNYIIILHARTLIRKLCRLCILKLFQFYFRKTFFLQSVFRKVKMWLGC